jgi:hypothetical protein
LAQKWDPKHNFGKIRFSFKRWFTRLTILYKSRLRKR